MTQRIALGALAISVVVGLVGSDALLARTPPFLNDLLVRGSLIPCAVALISALACLELASLFRRMGVAPYRRWGVICCVVLVLAPWFGAAGLLGGGPTELEAVHLQTLLIAVALLGAGAIGVFRADVTSGLANISGTWLIIGYAGVLPSFFIMLRCDPYGPGEAGAWIVLTVILVCKASDIGAYFVGSWIGRRRLCPRVSPAKSVQGFIGGLIASCALSVIFFQLHVTTAAGGDVPLDPSFRDNIGRLIHDITVMCHGMNCSQAIVFGAVISLAGQLGDLVESVFKRSAGAKDSGHVLPGFGGILDMIDSPVAVAPVAWFLLTGTWAVL